MKIAVTICDCHQTVFVGGDPERTTVIIELTDEQIPPVLKRYIADRKHASKNETPYYTNASLSLIVDAEGEVPE